MIVVYTDGACLGNPGPGGWAAIIKYGNGDAVVSLTGGDINTTNNRMELTAVLNALNFLSEGEDIGKIEIRTDSQYITNAINEGWLKKWKKEGFADRPNKKLWQLLDGFLDRFDVTFTWIKGHSGDEDNEKCDRLAKKEAEEAKERLRKYVTMCDDSDDGD